MGRAGDLAEADPDAAFIFYWIAFNAAYARDLEPDSSGQARNDFARFFGQLVDLDAERRIFMTTGRRVSAIPPLPCAMLSRARIPRFS
jgi:hypothetical protein